MCSTREAFGSMRYTQRHKGITSRHEQEEKKTTDHDDLGYLATVNIVIGKIKNFMSVDGVSLLTGEQRYHFGTAKNT